MNPPSSKPIALLLTLILLLLNAAGMGQEGAGEEGADAPGALLELIPTGTYTAAQVDANTAGRFRNDGETPPSAQTPVDSYLMRYQSSWPDGTPAQVTAQLFVPQQPADTRKLFVFGPGSTGLVEACAPSRAFVDSRTFDTYGAYTLAYAGQGIVSVMPNYLGFFDVGTIQPYFDRVAEGRVMLDAIRAAGAALEQLEVPQADLPAFVGGYSQGGHAAFAAADLLAEYAPEVPLMGVVGFGPTTIMSNLFLEFTFVAPWVIHALTVFEPEAVDPAELLLPPYRDSLAADAERLCILEAQNYYPSSPERLFTGEFVGALRAGTLQESFPGLAGIFTANDAGLAGHGVPAIILQGVDDPVVHIDSQTAFVAQICEHGSAVRYPNYLRTRHETRYIGFRDAIDWMEQLASGAEAPSDCAAVLNR